MRCIDSFISLYVCSAPPTHTGPRRLKRKCRRAGSGGHLPAGLTHIRPRASSFRGASATRHSAAFPKSQQFDHRSQACFHRPLPLPQFCPTTPHPVLLGTAQLAQAVRGWLAQRPPKRGSVEYCPLAHNAACYTSIAHHICADFLISTDIKILISIISRIGEGAGC